MQFLKKSLIQAIAIIGLWLLMSFPALAYPEGMLISTENFPLNIYPQPNQEQSAIGNGNVGDKVMILEKAYNNQGEIWDRIRLMSFPQIEGWIADSYINKLSETTVSNNPYDPKNYYQPNQFE